MNRALCILLTAACAASTTGAAIPVRTPLGVVRIVPGKTVNRVETTRVDFLPGRGNAGAQA